MYVTLYKHIGGTVIFCYTKFIVYPMYNRCKFVHALYICYTEIIHLKSIIDA